MFFFHISRTVLLPVVFQLGVSSSLRVFSLLRAVFSLVCIIERCRDGEDSWKDTHGPNQDRGTPLPVQLYHPRGDCDHLSPETEAAAYVGMWREKRFVCTGGRAPFVYLSCPVRC